MIREAIENVNKFEFKYNEEHWQVSFKEDKIEIDVDAGGKFMTAAVAEVKVRNQKDALKKAKKIIDGLDHQY